MLANRTLITFTPKRGYLFQRDQKYNYFFPKKSTTLKYIRPNGSRKYISPNGNRKYKRNYQKNRQSFRKSKTYRRKILDSYDLYDSYDSFISEKVVNSHHMKHLSLFDCLKGNEQKLVRKIIRSSRHVNFSEGTKDSSTKTSSSQYDFLIAECLGLAYAPRKGAVTDKEII